MTDQQTNSEKPHVENRFCMLAKINVNDKIEKKNGLSYLSWAYAVDQLLRQDGEANWSFGEPARWNDTVMVFCTVTAFGKSMTCQLPVMDHRNKAIPNPDAFQVNVAMQRCLAKAIALHGLGLYIYAGEDLPEGDNDSKAAESQNGDRVAEEVMIWWTVTATDVREHSGVGKQSGKPYTFYDILFEGDRKASTFDRKLADSVPLNRAIEAQVKPGKKAGAFELVNFQEIATSATESQSENLL